MDKSERFEVCGTDPEGDHYLFRSDDPERAKAQFDQMSEDLEDVTIAEKP